MGLESPRWMPLQAGQGYAKYKGTRPEDKKVLYGTKLCVINNQLFDLTVNYEGSQ
jgi:hypothetical protein